MERASTTRIIGYCLGVLVGGGLVVLAVLQQGTISRLREENRSLTAEAGREQPGSRGPAETPPLLEPENDLLRLRNEVQQLQEVLRHQQPEIQQLREQNQDVLRLRNEVHQLRQQQQELEVLRTANARLLQSIEGVSLSSNQLAWIDAARKDGAILGILTRSADASARYPGAMVMQMMTNSPSAASDLKLGDIIIRIDGRPIESVGELQAEMLAKKPGETVILDVMRGDTPVRITVQTRAWPEP